jgi:hypothetical protein
MRLRCILTTAALSLSVLSLPPSARAQSSSVRGFVTGGADQIPLTGATVAIYRGEELIAGAATDGDGFYFLRRIQAGGYLIRISYVGYRTLEDTLTLSPGEDRIFVAALAKSPRWADEIVITAARVDDAVQPAAGFPTTVTARDIELIPAPDVSGDLANLLAAQPAIVTQGDRGGQIYFQGGEPTHNLVLLDGMAIYQPFHLIGYYSYPGRYRK